MTALCRLICQFWEMAQNVFFHLLCVLSLIVEKYTFKKKKFLEKIRSSLSWILSSNIYFPLSVAFEGPLRNTKRQRDRASHSALMLPDLIKMTQEGVCSRATIMIVKTSGSVKCVMTLVAVWHQCQVCHDTSGSVTLWQCDTPALAPALSAAGPRPRPGPGRSYDHCSS